MAEAIAARAAGRRETEGLVVRLADFGLAKGADTPPNGATAAAASLVPLFLVSDLLLINQYLYMLARAYWPSTLIKFHPARDGTLAAATPSVDAGRGVGRPAAGRGLRRVYYTGSLGLGRTFVG